MKAAAPYVPRALLEHRAVEPERRVLAADGTCVFVDVAGFTKLSERLARRGGREGAEQLADAIGSCFRDLLGVAYENGGGLLKFGGDALMLMFDGPAHAARGCASAVTMGVRLRELGPSATQPPEHRIGRRKRHRRRNQRQKHERAPGHLRVGPPTSPADPLRVALPGVKRAACNRARTGGS